MPVNLSGSSGALRVWADIMAQQGFEPFKLSRDASLEWRFVDPVDGGIVQQTCDNGVLLPFPKAQVPSTRSACR